VTLESGLPGGDYNNQQAAFHKTDLRLNYAPDSDKWSVSLWLKNLENKAQTTQVLPFGRVQVTDPRTFGLNLSYKL
jgi:outer membrane receptor protein involved in Fe transport